MSNDACAVTWSALCYRFYLNAMRTSALLILLSVLTVKWIMRLYGPLVCRTLTNRKRFRSRAACNCNTHIRFTHSTFNFNSLVDAKFLSGGFSPLTSAEACDKNVVGGFGKNLCKTWCEKARITCTSPTAMI